MAMKPLPPYHPLDPHQTKTAALASGAMCLAGALAMGLVIAMADAAWLRLAGGLAGAVWLSGAAASVALLRGRLWAYKGLLALWALVAMAAAVALAADLLATDLPVRERMGRVVGLAPVLVAAAGGVWLLMRAARAGTRVRFAARRSMGAGIMLVLVVVVNLVAQAASLRVGFERLGQYGLSERTRRVLDTVDEPVRLTLIAGSPARARQTGRTLELLLEMEQYNPRVSVAFARTEADRAATAERLRQRDTDRAVIAPADPFAPDPAPGAVDADWADRLTGDAVLVEVGDQAEVVAFEEIWPLRSGTARAGDEIERVFHGNAAIAGRILGMTRPPFGVVHLAYLPPSPAEAGHPLERYSLLRRRLEEANFVVRPWSLDDALPSAIAPAGAADGSREATADVLIVLPPAGVRPIEPDQAARIRQAMDAGTPTLVLTHAFPARQLVPDDALLTVLRGDWGIHVRSGHLVVPAEPDGEHPGRFRLELDRLTHYPLSTFSDHRIARPLQARRLLWTALCPVEAMEILPPGVEISPLLLVPPRSGAFASRRLDELARELYRQDGLLTPDFQAGDIAPPFAVAVAASRAGQEGPGPAPTRLVVLATALSLTDGYLRQPVVHLAPEGPVNNLDLPVNAVYWLSGWEHYIAAGPAIVQPVGMIPSWAYTTLWIVVVLVLPAGVGIAGVAVLRHRRR